MKIGNLIRSVMFPSEDFEPIVLLIVGEERSCGEHCFICLESYGDRERIMALSSITLNKFYEVIS